MTFDDYQEQASVFGHYDEKGIAALALAEEAGEYAGKMKRYLRGDSGFFGPQDSDARRARLHELGDILWSLQEACWQESTTLEMVALMNITKLTQRQARGTIQGEGDDR